MTVHNGIITHESVELLQMHGADFTRHDPMASLRIELGEDVEPLLTEGFEPYEELDEPYEYRFDTFFDDAFDVWLYYFYKDEKRPAAWHRKYGEGHMLYLMQGHNKQAAEHPMFVQLLRNACRYLLHQQDENK